MKKVLTLIIACFIMTGCVPEENRRQSTDSVAAQRQARVTAEIERQTGTPSIVNGKEKKMMKMLYELRDQEDLICYAYFFNEHTGELGQFIGKCAGYGISASTQYSNPERIASSHTGYQSTRSWVKLPQAEPNGLFMPQSSSATWLMVFDDKGVPRPCYIEPLISVFPFKVH